MAKPLPDPVISDAEIAYLLDRRQLVRMPRNWGEPPTDPRVLAELRMRVRAYVPPKLRRKKKAA